MTEIKETIGICAGASTLTFVHTRKENSEINIKEVESFTHHGNPKKVLKEYFQNHNAVGKSVLFTGRKFKDIINGFSIPEPEAIETAFKHLGLNGKYDTIASLGGENFIIYSLDNKGSVKTVFTGNKCASGTGEFFLQQIGRMNLGVDEAVEVSAAENIYKVSGRCSVFCKSDCTHALNKGIPKGQVVSGLSKMIADKTLELLSKQNSDKIIIIGGVSRNTGVMKFIRNEYPVIHIPDEAIYFEALGAKKQRKMTNVLSDLMSVQQQLRQYF
jgi:activator of 2-hydroxyglutaryl-CoA dehydratase